MSTAETKLQSLGITLPEAPMPAANYVPYVISGDLVFISGQLPLINGKMAHAGHVGKDVTTREAAEQARICAINLIAQLRAACGGDLGRVEQVVKLLVACTNDFGYQPEVINGHPTDGRI